MMKSEITEEDDEEICWLTGAQREKIRHIIEHQKSLYWSSSSSSSLSSSLASCSSLSSCRKKSTFLDLMKGGSSSLRRLFDMEHTSLSTYFDNYSGSPVTKPILLWGSDADDEQAYDPWESIKQIGRPRFDPSNEGLSNFASDGSSFRKEDPDLKNKKEIIRSHRKLRRKKSFRRLPGFGFWRFRGFRFRLRLRRLKIMICGRKM